MLSYTAGWNVRWLELQEDRSGNTVFKVLNKKLFRRGVVVLLSALLAWLAFLAYEIVSFSGLHSDRAADAAVVLGAAVRGDRPSPVFRERIAHAISLYKSGKVKKIVFTGGRQDRTQHAESEVARDYALRHGVRPGDILIETVSTSTFENLVQAGRLAREQLLMSLLLVSDPLHMKRAVRMAQDMGLQVRPAPTPTSRYRGTYKKLKFLLRELYFYQRYLLIGR